MRPRGEAPGLMKVRGVEWWWSAARASKRPEAKTFRPRMVRLRQDDEAERAAKCRELTAELTSWCEQEARGGNRLLRFDGTIRSLNRIYETHPDSPRRSVSFATGRVYDTEAKVLVDAVGDRRIDRITGADLRRWHTNFAKPATPGGAARIRRAQGAMKTLRRIVSWGVVMRLDGCRDLREILAEMRFAMPAPREHAPSYAQVADFIAAAHAAGRPSLAMAAALMFDTSLRQTDVIGKWEPAPDAKATGGYVHAGRRWSGGVLWQDITAGRLTKRTTKTGAKANFTVADFPLVTAEIDRVPEDRRIGPMVVDEQTGRPYRHRWFAALWRRIARQAGIPDEVWSRDTRAGAITEAFDAGAELEHVRQMATHSDPKVTGRYNRGSTEQTSTVATLRRHHRAKGTE